MITTIINPIDDNDNQSQSRWGVGAFLSLARWEFLCNPSDITKFFEKLIPYLLTTIKNWNPYLQKPSSPKYNTLHPSIPPSHHDSIPSFIPQYNYLHSSSILHRRARGCPARFRPPSRNCSSISRNITLSHLAAAIYRNFRSAGSRSQIPEPCET